MNEAIETMIKEFDGTVLLGGTVVMFSTKNFIEFFKKVYETGADKGYADAMNWKVQNHLEHLPTKGESDAN